MCAPEMEAVHRACVARNTKALYKAMADWEKKRDKIQGRKTKVFNMQRSCAIARIWAGSNYGWEI